MANDLAWTCTEAAKLRAEHAASGTAWTFEDWLSLHVVQLRAKVGSLPAETPDKRLEIARAAAREGAWRDLLAAFTDKQRQHIAMLLAHHWHIGSVVLRNTTEGRDYSNTVTGERSAETTRDSEGG